jgi:predicted nuclease of predicted toxin-antitoxin system
LKLLIDECLHTSLTNVAHANGYAADHVNHLKLDNSPDWQLLAVALEKDYTFVTNNGADFLRLYRRERLHPGLIIIVRMWHRCFNASSLRRRLDILESRDLTNTVAEVTYAGNLIKYAEYPWAPER